MTIYLVIPREFRQLLAELEMLSHGSCQAWNKASSPSERDPRPDGEAHPPHLEYRRRWIRAGSDLEREQVHQAAFLALRDHRRKPNVTTRQEPEHLRRKEIIERGEGWDASEVARVYKTTVREIITIRAEANRDPSTGRVPPAEEDRADQARRMFGEGMTVRQIAEFQKVPKTTIGRVVRRAA